MIVIILWTCTLLGLFFGAFRVMGLLRTSAEEEAAGLDESKHGGSAYNMAGPGPVHPRLCTSYRSGQGPRDVR